MRRRCLPTRCTSMNRDRSPASLGALQGALAGLERHASRILAGPDLREGVRGSDSACGYKEGQRLSILLGIHEPEHVTTDRVLRFLGLGPRCLGRKLHAPLADLLRLELGALGGGELDAGVVLIVVDPGTGGQHDRYQDAAYGRGNHLFQHDVSYS